MACLAFWKKEIKWNVLKWQYNIGVKDAWGPQKTDEMVRLLTDRWGGSQKTPRLAISQHTCKFSTNHFQIENDHVQASKNCVDDCKKNVSIPKCCLVIS